MRGDMIKSIILIVVGFILLTAAAIVPLPVILGVSGAIWRIIIGLLGCFLFVFSIYKMIISRK
mgnify:CR=1 FL=1